MMYWLSCLAGARHNQRSRMVARQRQVAFVSLRFGSYTSAFEVIFVREQIADSPAKLRLTLIIIR